MWVPYTPEHLVEGFDGSFSTGPEYALSTRWVPLLFDGGWELNLGERAFRCVLGSIRIPFLPPSRRSWPLNQPISDIPMGGLDRFLLSDGPSTSVDFALWWVPRTIGAHTRATLFLGDIVPGSMMMTNWMAYVREPTHLAQIASLTQEMD